MCYVFLTPKNHVHSFLQILDKTKIEPYLLTVEGSALTSLLEGMEASSPIKSGCYMHVGFKDSLVLIFQEGNLESLHPIDWGYKSIVDKISTTYKLAPQEAYNQFSDKAFILTEHKGFTKEQVYFSSIVKKEVHSLIEKFKLTKISVETEVNFNFEKIFLIGPGCRIKNLSAFLSKETQLFFSRLERLPKFPQLNLEEPNTQSALIAIGQALEGLRLPPYGGVNLVRTFRETKLLTFKKKWRNVLAAMALSVLVFTVYSWVRRAKTQSLADNVHQIFLDYSRKITKLKSKNITIPSIKRFLREKRLERSSYKTLRAKMQEATPLDYIKTLTSTLKVRPEWNFKITSLKVQDRKISMQGEIDQRFDKILRTRLQLLAENSVIRRGDKRASTKNPYTPQAQNQDVPTKTKKQEEGMKQFYYSFKKRQDLK